MAATRPANTSGMRRLGRLEVCRADVWAALSWVAAAAEVVSFLATAMCRILPWDVPLGALFLPTTLNMPMMPIRIMHNDDTKNSNAPRDC